MFAIIVKFVELYNELNRVKAAVKLGFLNTDFFEATICINRNYVYYLEYSLSK